MHINGLHINGFGNLYNRSFDFKNHRLTVVFAENGIGKSTLKQFIRMMLFGFPSRGFRQHHPPIDDAGAPRGGVIHGGRMEIILDNGRSSTIQRYVGLTGHENLVDGESIPNVNEFLGSVTQDHYESVFSFNSDQLHSLDRREDGSSDDELERKIFSVSSGVPQLPSVLKTLQKKKEEIYKKSGKNQPVAKVLERLKELDRELKEVGQELDTYDDTVLERNNLNKTIDELTAELENKELRKSELEKYSNSWETWMDFKQVEEQLKLSPNKSGFPDDPIAKIYELETLEKDISTAQEAIREKQRQAEKTNQKVKQPIQGEELLGIKEVCTRIQEKRALYTSSNSLLKKRKNEHKTLASELTRTFYKLGKDWADQHLETFDNSVIVADKTQEFKTDLDTATKECNDVKAQVALRVKDEEEEIHKKNHGPQSSTGEPWSTNLSKSIVITSSVLLSGLVGLSVALDISWLWSVAVVGGAVVLLSLLYYWPRLSRLFRSSSSSRENLEAHQKKRDAAEEELRKKEESVQKVSNDWSKWKEQNNFPEALQLETAQEFLSEVTRAREQQEKIKKLEDAIYGDECVIKEYSQDVERAAQLIKKFRPSEKELDIFSYEFQEMVDKLSQTIMRLFTEAGKQSATRLTQKKALEELNSELVKSENELKAYQKSLDELLAAGNASNPAKFRQKANRKKLEDRLRREWMFKYDVDALREMYTSNPKDQGETELADLEDRLPKLRKEKEATREKIGALGDRIRVLSSNERASELRASREQYKADLRALTREWSKLAVARAFLEQAQKKYEKENQPELFRLASKWLKEISRGKYERIYHASEEEKEGTTNKVMVVHRDGTEKTASEMSTGERHSLYLALRFGFLFHSLGKQEPLPIIVDDPLIAIDKPGSVIAANGFIKLSQQDHQVFFLTCHPHVVKIFEQASPDVNVVNL